MSIASEITRLQQAKADIKTAIENKGVTVPSDATLDDYADLVDSISGGGGTDWESIARAFCGDSTPTTLVIPEGITKLRNYAFYRMPITKVILPSTLINPTGGSCFDSCASLSEVELGSGIIILTQRFFSGCTNLKSLTIPAQVIRINNYAFTTLNELICLPTTPPIIESNVVRYVSTDIYVPDDSLSAYQSATNWTSAASKIKPISERPTT